LLLFVLFTLLAQAQEKPPDRCTVSGTVVDSVTEKPLGKVDIALIPTDRGAHDTAATKTDAEGRFTLVDLDPGSYRLYGSRTGYRITTYGTRRPDSDGAILRLDPGQTLDGLKFKIIPGAVLSGRVVDPDGDPVGNAHVTLNKREGRHGRSQIQGSVAIEADDQGVFRFSGLSADRYYLLAEDRSSDRNTYVDHSPRTARPLEALIPTLYPGAPDLASAAPLDLRPGERREGLEIRLLRTRVFRVRGRVVNSRAGNVTVRLRPIAIEFLHDTNLQAHAREGSGEFEFRNVAPGAYWLQLGYSTTRIEVGFADLEGLRVDMGQPAEVRIAVTAEGSDPPPSLAVTLFITTDGRNGAMFETEADGRATRTLNPGVFDVEVFRGLMGYYVKSMRSGERDVLADRLDVPPSGSIPLDIVLAADGGKVEGGVGEPLAGATVVLVPEVRTRVDRYQTAPTDQYGRFTFTAVPPGAYKAFAWDDVKEDDWFDPDFLKLYESQGVELKVEPRATKSLDLKIARDK
jgi:hypothetical protein